MSTDLKAAKAYLAALGRRERAGLQTLRKSIASVLPTAELGMSYGIPSFKLNGRPVVWFAAFKLHSSFFPGAAAIRKYAKELERYKISKGTIQFPSGNPPPARLVAKLVRARLADMKKRKK